MRINKTANAKKGLKYGVLYKLATMIMPFLVQTTINYTLGIEYLGISGLFSSVLSVLSLSELGLGTAIVYSMYEPIANDDKETICSLYNFYKIAYRGIGALITVAGLAITPFITLFIKDECPKELNIYVLFLMYLLKTVISYWMYAYKSSLLVAFQRTDKISIAGTIIQTIFSVLQIVILLLFKNFYVSLGITIIGGVANNLLISKTVNRLFPEYECKGKLNPIKKKEIKKNVLALSIGKISSATRNTFDNIFISAFIGLAASGVYSGYFYIMNTLVAFLTLIGSVLEGGIGNSIVKDSIEKNASDMRKMDFLYMMITGWSTVCLLCLYQPFIRIWLRKEFSISVSVLFSVYFYILNMSTIRSLYSDGKGLYWENRIRYIVEGIANIILNYVLVKKFGVNGIIFATIITIFFCGYIPASVILFNKYFKNGMLAYFGRHSIYMFVTFCISFITYRTCLLYDGNEWSTLIVRALICIPLSGILYLLVYFKTPIFRESYTWINKRVLKREKDYDKKGY